MKKYKFLALTALTAVLLASLASCRMSLNPKQELMYGEFITSLASMALNGEVEAKTIKEDLDSSNENDFKPLGFKVIDKRAGKPVAQFTSVEVLKKRFVPVKR